MDAIIFVPTEAESIKVQRRLFSCGIDHSGRHGKVCGESSPFLIVTGTDLAHCHSFEYVTRDYCTYRFIDAYSVKQHFIPPEPEKMITVDGKEWSESTVKAALRDYVA